MESKRILYQKHRYSGMRVNKNRSRAAFKRCHGVEGTRSTMWIKKKSTPTLNQEMERKKNISKKKTEHTLQDSNLDPLQLQLPEDPQYDDGKSMVSQTETSLDTAIEPTNSEEPVQKMGLTKGSLSTAILLKPDASISITKAIGFEFPLKNTEHGGRCNHSLHYYYNPRSLQQDTPPVTKKAAQSLEQRNDSERISLEEPMVLSEESTHSDDPDPPPVTKHEDPSVEQQLDSESSCLEEPMVLLEKSTHSEPDPSDVGIELDPLSGQTPRIVQFYKTRLSNKDFIIKKKNAYIQILEQKIRQLENRNNDEKKDKTMA